MTPKRKKTRTEKKRKAVVKEQNPDQTEIDRFKASLIINAHDQGVILAERVL